jgi:hypothetical protein
MTFESRHWTFEDYFDALAGASLLVAALREIPDRTHPRWSRSSFPSLAGREDIPARIGRPVSKLLLDPQKLV